MNSTRAKGLGKTAAATGNGAAGERRAPRTQLRDPSRVYPGGLGPAQQRPNYSFEELDGIHTQSWVKAAGPPLLMQNSSPQTAGPRPGLDKTRCGSQGALPLQTLPKSEREKQPANYQCVLQTDNGPGATPSRLHVACGHFCPVELSNCSRATCPAKPTY